MIPKDDGPRFVLADVCDVLGLVNTGDAAQRLDADEKMTIGNPDSRAGRGAQLLNIISESGLWSLVLTSRKPEAKRFKKWLTSEVIPSIRQTGGYRAPEVKPAPLPAYGMPPELLGLLREQTELMKAASADRCIILKWAEAPVRPLRSA